MGEITIFATDGSEYSAMAAELIKRIPSLKAGKVIAVQVIPPMPVTFDIVEPVFSGALTHEVDEMFEAQRVGATANLTAAVNDLKSAGIDADYQLLEGDISQQILDFAKDSNATTIALGSKGVGGFQGFFLGSIAKGLVDHAPQSLIVARPGPDHDEKSALAKLKASPTLRVGVCVDGSDGANHALSVVINQGENAFASAYGFTAEPLSALPPGVLATEYVAEVGDCHEAVQAILVKTTNQLSTVAAASKGFSEVGDPSSALGSLAKQHEVDLLVLGANRHGMVERFLLGSVSHDLAANAPCSIWVIRPTG